MTDIDLRRRVTALEEAVAALIRGGRPAINEKVPIDELRVNGVGMITKERMRQVVEEGWDAQHDAGHEHGILAIAAAELAVDGTDARVENPHQHDHCGSLGKYGVHGSKPDRLRALTIAGALIAGEIDRILEAERRQTTR